MALRQQHQEHRTKYPSDSPVMAAIAEILCLAGYVRQVNFRWDRAGSIYRLDFAHFKRKINVEIETPGRRTTPEKDARRDANLKAQNWQVVRVPIEEATIDRLRRDCCWWLEGI